ncbi:alpha-galactosidase [Gracilibacillus halophilus YIM-C55.5]|uniref:Alpha-galactosidase n=1 Tax=Gracilibacillus halophilus YIM-C55.5 TaxID=1308866 RepID=N4WNP7_9BACI|nr:alpha-galactosidase [Gracilibacillus halophilus]ENH97772.1 alpha-galactosidase [Gracilibacillus halophilus YIM-C55.5]
MPIIYNDQTNEFHLQTKHSSYIFNILENSQLGHLYYGKRIRHKNSFHHLLETGHRSNITYLQEGDMTFSLEQTKQEYPSYGTTDFREPAFQIIQENGSRITDFKYKSHKIYQGKPKLNGLPATYTEAGDDVETLEVYLYDEVIAAELLLIYSVFEEYDAIVRSANFKNCGEKNLHLSRVMSMNVDLPDADYEMMQLSGAWIRERHVKSRKLESGIQQISSTRGASSSQHNPFLALKRSHTTEFDGDVYGFSFVYSGNFLAQVEVDYLNVARVSLGIHPFDFHWLLEQGESFQTPEVVMTYSNEGLNGMSQNFHQLYQSRLVRGKWRDHTRPILTNNWEGTYFDFNEEKIVEMAKQSKELGVELFVLDDGWFGKRDDDTTSLGDWYVDYDKLPNGITGLAEKITDLGMAFGLWFEPEMVSKMSQLYKTHPDWMIHVPDRQPSHGRNQYVLDFSRKEVVDAIYDMMAQVLRDAPISYVKWDMNRYMTEIGSAALPPNRQQEVTHRYILGVYDLYERLTSEFPNVLFESCASGGCRFDPGMLYYAPQTWTSDNTDAIERLNIQYGTSYVYPISTMGAHVSAVPNHQVGRMTSLRTRAEVAYFGAFGYELDVTTLSNEDKSIVKEQIDFFKQHRETFQFGSFYRLNSPFEKDGNRTSWIVVAKDQSKAIVGDYHVLCKPNEGFRRLQLKGLEESASYQIEGYEGIYNGDELMEIGILLDHERFKEYPEHHVSGDFYSRLFVLYKYS